MASADVGGGGRSPDKPKECLRRRLLGVDLYGTKVLVSKEIVGLRRRASMKLIKENLTIAAPSEERPELV